jgi:hypothetical protein
VHDPDYEVCIDVVEPKSPPILFLHFELCHLLQDGFSQIFKCNIRFDNGDVSIQEPLSHDQVGPNQLYFVVRDIPVNKGELQ